jgi:hypothetical protein
LSSGLEPPALPRSKISTDILAGFSAGLVGVCVAVPLSGALVGSEVDGVDGADGDGGDETGTQAARSVAIIAQASSNENVLFMVILLILLLDT